MPNLPPAAPDGGPPSRSSLLVEDVLRLLERFEHAQKRRRLACLTEEDTSAYEAEVLEAAAEERAASNALADLYLLLLRYARTCRPEALATSLSESLRPELVEGLTEHFENLARRIVAAELPDALRAGYAYQPPDEANPGNVIRCKAGGGNMGGPLCHENEAPFPEEVPEHYIRSFCPPGGLVLDPFVGSGTTGAVAVRLGRRFAGCDIRPEQVELARLRISQAAPPPGAAQAAPGGGEAG
jgi:hypothetical protein